MPSLTPEQRTALLGPVPGLCPHCDGERIRHYCRQCDEFFLACGCSGQAANTAHLEHRVYLWTPEGIRAVPNYDLW